MQKLSSLLAIVGGVLAGFTATRLPIHPVIVAVIGGFFLGFSVYAVTSVFSGTIWGVRIKSTSQSKILQLISVFGLIIGGYSIVFIVLTLLVNLFAGQLLICVLCIVGFVIPLAISPFIEKAIAEKILSKGNNAQALEQFQIFHDIDENIDSAVNFVVGFEGVALFSNTNYCYAVYLYEDYQLGELSTPKEVALVGTYFVQKYHDEFTFKVDVEVIPGEPGQTVVAVGAGGVTVGKTSGTRDQRLFRSYIFTRR